MTDTNRAEPMKGLAEWLRNYANYSDRVGSLRDVDELRRWAAEVEASRLPLAGAGDAAVQQPVAWIDRHQHPWNKDLGWVSDLRWTRDECEGEATPLYRAALAAAPLERIARFLTSQEVKAVYRTIDVIYDEELRRMFAEVNGITLAQGEAKGK